LRRYFPPEPTLSARTKPLIRSVGSMSAHAG
jgi:hypothetical protein